MATMTNMTCKCGCGRSKQVRTADVKRGWGKFFSKSCKAREQEGRTGQFADFKERAENEGEESGWGHPHASGWEGHGQE